MSAAGEVATAIARMKRRTKNNGDSVPSCHGGPG